MNDNLPIFAYLTFIVWGDCFLSQPDCQTGSQTMQVAPLPQYNVIITFFYPCLFISTLIVPSWSKFHRISRFDFRNTPEMCYSHFRGNSTKSLISKQTFPGLVEQENILKERKLGERKSRTVKLTNSFIRNWFRCRKRNLRNSTKKIITAPLKLFVYKCILHWYPYIQH